MITVLLDGLVTIIHPSRHSSIFGYDELFAVRISPRYFQEALEEGRFVITAELVLGRDHTASEAAEFVRHAASEPDGIRVVSLTDLPGGNPAFPPEAFIDFALEQGLDPIAHLSGKDVNRNFLEARLHALASRGVRNVLALTGDALREGFAGRGKPVHDLDSVQILWLIDHFKTGLTWIVGNRIAQSTPYWFFPGATVNPYKLREPDQMMQLFKLELKIAAGAGFIIPQLGFNLRKLYELKQYMSLRGLGHIPVLANVYVPTAAIARVMDSGELPGCIVPPALLRSLETEKKPQRLERAALMVAAARDLGFAGAHLGGFGLTHRDFLTIRDRAAEIGSDWRKRLDELVLECPGQFYLFPVGPEGLSDPSKPMQLNVKPDARLVQHLSRLAHRHLIATDSLAARVFRNLLRAGPGTTAARLAAALLAPSTWFRRALLGCMNCGDCVQDHLDYAGCPVGRCYKELRNGPCGGSRPDGNCEARPDVPCLWNLVYQSVPALGRSYEDLKSILIPPRDWRLDRTNALVNRFTGRDNYPRRQRLKPHGEGSHGDHWRTDQLHTEEDSHRG